MFKHQNARNLLASISKLEAKKLLERLPKAKFFAHTYAFALNLDYGTYTLWEFMNYAVKHKLSGMKIHVSYLERFKLQELQEYKKKAKEHNLEIHLELSNTEREHVDKAVSMALILGAKHIRLYQRYSGRISEIIQKTINDLKYAAQVAHQMDLYFALEQHEVEKSKELVYIIQQVNSERVRLLFDFGNMVNANEDPMEALKIQAPYIQHVHLKDLVTFPSAENGTGQLGVPSGQGSIDQFTMMYHLLMLGDKEPQIVAFGLEEQNWFKSPAYRFPNEEEDPFIPPRVPSDTEFPEGIAQEFAFMIEREYADRIVYRFREIMETLERVAKYKLEAPTCIPV
jgi:sugar phosphate isomerase/epimerase